MGWEELVEGVDLGLGSSLCGPLRGVAWPSWQNLGRFQSRVLHDGRMRELQTPRLSLCSYPAFLPEHSICENKLQGQPRMNMDGDSPWVWMLRVVAPCRTSLETSYYISQWCRSSTLVNSCEAAISQSGRARRTWILACSATNYESSLSLFLPWSYCLQNKNFQEQWFSNIEGSSNISWVLVKNTNSWAPLQSY